MPPLHDSKEDDWHTEGKSNMESRSQTRQEYLSMIFYCFDVGGTIWARREKRKERISETDVSGDIYKVTWPSNHNLGDEQQAG